MPGSIPQDPSPGSIRELRDRLGLEPLAASSGVFWGSSALCSGTGRTGTPLPQAGLGLGMGLGLGQGLGLGLGLGLAVPSLGATPMSPEALCQHKHWPPVGQRSQRGSFVSETLKF